MNDINDIFFSQDGTMATQADLLLAKVGAYTSGSGTTLIFDGQSTATTKKYKRLSTYTPTAGARVLVARINGTYVILGAVVS